MPQELDKEEARAGQTGVGVRYVLIISTGLAAIALFAFAAGLIGRT